MTRKEILDLIEARVRLTICPTFNPAQGETIEGRILQQDFDLLMLLARKGAEPLGEHIVVPGFEWAH